MTLQICTSLEIFCVIPQANGENSAVYKYNLSQIIWATTAPQMEYN